MSSCTSTYLSQNGDKLFETDLVISVWIKLGDKCFGVKVIVEDTFQFFFSDMAIIVSVQNLEHPPGTWVEGKCAWLKSIKFRFFNFKGSQVLSGKLQTSLDITSTILVSLCAIITCHVATEEVVHHVQISSLIFFHDCRGILIAKYLEIMCYYH